jgi:hypothetical protein
MQQISAEAEYKRLIAAYSEQLNELNRRRRWFAVLRLILAVMIVALLYYLFFNSTMIVWSSLAISITAFIFTIARDADNTARIVYLNNLIAINDEELSIRAGIYSDREDGHEYLTSDHPYSADIDLFGPASLYQYMNRCTSTQGKNLLAHLLLNASTTEEIAARQQAAASLAAHVTWRQNFQEAGAVNSVTKQTEEKILNWHQQRDALNSSFWQIIPNVFTVFSLGTVIVYIFDFISGGIFTFIIIAYLIFANYTSGRVIKTYQRLSKIEPEVNTIEQQLKLVESNPVDTGLLGSYKKELLESRNGSPATRELKNILKCFDYRLNVYVFILLNTFLLWDVRQTNRLNQWKKKYQTGVPKWFHILANVEVINTLATLTFNHADWKFPKVVDDHFTLTGEEIGHPLIREQQRVDNSFLLSGTGKVTIITGSNMAGKSTYLRTLAVNLVLAQMGAPVCAKSFTCSSVDLFTSMRVADNLAENTSTFYAELKKLKRIIDEVKAHRKVFILLDEILRGTNSLDRHTGSEALIRQLIKANAVAVIATHDLELASLQKQFSSAIENYHFDVMVEGEELYFDYKLKSGVCQSMNASLLMKKIGIEI